MAHLIDPPTRPRRRVVWLARFPVTLLRLPITDVSAAMRVATLAAVSMALPGACGGGAGDGTRTEVGAAEIVTTGWTKSEAVGASPEPGDRAAAPLDRHARTRSGRYLSRATAERLSEEAGGHLWVDAGAWPGLDPELPERIAFGVQAILGEDATVYVIGSDLRQAARLADRLDALGITRVHLVTP